MAILVTLLATAVSSPLNTQNGNQSRFPGATCIFSKCCDRQKRRARNSASDGQQYRAFWSPENRVMAILVTRLASVRASFQAEKQLEWQSIAISRGYVHFQQMMRETKTKSKKFRIRWSKVPRVLEPLKSSYGHVGHPPGHGRLKPKNTQNGNKSRFPGATCIFSKCCERQKQRARNSASDGQKYRAFWSP